MTTDSATPSATCAGFPGVKVVDGIADEGADPPNHGCRCLIPPSQARGVGPVQRRIADVCVRFLRDRIHWIPGDELSSGWFVVARPEVDEATLLVSVLTGELECRRQAPDSRWRQTRRPYAMRDRRPTAVANCWSANAADVRVSTMSHSRSTCHHQDRRRTARLCPSCCRTSLARWGQVQVYEADRRRFQSEPVQAQVSMRLITDDPPTRMSAMRLMERHSLERDPKH